MDIVKKNLLSIICGVIAIIAIVLIFFPLGGMFEELRVNTETSKKIGEEISSLDKQARTWPTLSPREEDRVPLTSFPTEGTIKVAENMTKSWSQAATAFLNEAISLQKSRFTLLEPRSLPTGGGYATGIRFIEAYQRKFGQYKNPQTGEVPQNDTIYTKVLNSTLPPSAEEIKNEQDRKANQIRADKTVRIGATEQNTEEVTRLVTEAVAKVADKMRSDRAYGYSIYADPATSLEWNPKIAGAQAPAVEDIFDAQFTLWIQEDICRAITEVNRSSNPDIKVIDAPIKRLHKLSILHDYRSTNSGIPAGGFGGGGGGLGAGAGAPAAATPAADLPSNPNNKISYNFTTSPFGHASNEFYDVVKFQLILTCDSGSLTNTLAGLTRDRYIMFTTLKVDSVDSAVDAVQGYFYGAKPVVLVTIQGEYLVLRPVIKPFVPPSVVQTLLNNLQAASGQPPAQ